MSDRPIAVGDLVVVVRGHSCVLELIGGWVYRVESIERQIGGGWFCNRCGTRDIAPEAMYGATGHRKPAGVNLLKAGRGPAAIPLQWLKRIPPLDELEGERTEEKTKEPA